ncbi:Hypothetical predicted protein [Octopus vulgaris]|uniref:Uncharacterized protein n=1 Tax=Octopus vulgaris TaxID=6645 RepID=A0AA36B3S3_OCTVU|nr:Hypothetical predicted protein [Octopus vulgaris]
MSPVNPSSEFAKQIHKEGSGVTGEVAAYRNPDQEDETSGGENVPSSILSVELSQQSYQSFKSLDIGKKRSNEADSDFAISNLDHLCS